MGSAVTHFGPGPNGTIRIMSRYGDSDTGVIGHSQGDYEPGTILFGIPFEQFVAAGCGIIDLAEDGTATIRSADDQSEDVEAGHE